MVVLHTPVRTGAAPFESDFDALLGELEAAPADAAQLADGRRWVAQELYAETPTLASLRLAAGMSQRQLAEACAIEQPHVSRYESGRHEPKLGIAVRWAAALGVDVETLYAAWAASQQKIADEVHGH